MGRDCRMEVVVTVVVAAAMEEVHPRRSARSSQACSRQALDMEVQARTDQGRLRHMEEQAARNHTEEAPPAAGRDTGLQVMARERTAAALRRTVAAAVMDSAGLLMRRRRIRGSVAVEAGMAPAGTDQSQPTGLVDMVQARCLRAIRVHLLRRMVLVPLAVTRMGMVEATRREVMVEAATAADLEDMVEVATAADLEGMVEVATASDLEGTVEAATAADHLEGTAAATVADHLEGTAAATVAGLEGTAAALPNQLLEGVTQAAAPMARARSLVTGNVHSAAITTFVAVQPATCAGAARLAQ